MEITLEETRTRILKIDMNVIKFARDLLIDNGYQGDDVDYLNTIIRTKKIKRDTESLEYLHDILEEVEDEFGESDGFWLEDYCYYNSTQVIETLDKYY